MKYIKLSLFVVLICCASTFLHSCKDCDDMRPDMNIPEFISPDLVRKYFNPYDYTGASYKNEFYYSVKWAGTGPYVIPAFLMMPYLPGPVAFFPYADPYNRFTITGADRAGNYYVLFPYGLWNQGGYIYYGQYNTGVVVGDSVIVYKYLFNNQETGSSGLFKKDCDPVQTKPSKVRIRVTKDGAPQSEKKEPVDKMLPNTFKLVTTVVKFGAQGFYEVNGTADIDNDNDEKNENNNDEPPKAPIEWGKRADHYGIRVD